MVIIYKIINVLVDFQSRKVTLRPSTRSSKGQPEKLISGPSHSHGHLPTLPLSLCHPHRMPFPPLSSPLTALLPSIQMYWGLGEPLLLIVPDPAPPPPPHSPSQPCIFVDLLPRTFAYHSIVKKSKELANKGSVPHMGNGCKSVVMDNINRGLLIITTVPEKKKRKGAKTAKHWVILKSVRKLKGISLCLSEYSVDVYWVG